MLLVSDQFVIVTRGLAVEEVTFSILTNTRMVAKWLLAFVRPQFMLLLTSSRTDVFDCYAKLRESVAYCVSKGYTKQPAK